MVKEHQGASSTRMKAQEDWKGAAKKRAEVTSDADLRCAAFTDVEVRHCIYFLDNVVEQMSPIRGGLEVDGGFMMLGGTHPPSQGACLQVGVVGVQERQVTRVWFTSQVTCGGLCFLCCRCPATCPALVQERLPCP